MKKHLRCLGLCCVIGSLAIFLWTVYPRLAQRMQEHEAISAVKDALLRAPYSWPWNGGEWFVVGLFAAGVFMLLAFRGK